jgi:arsenate reductase (glutaredoxin)
MVKIYGIPNCGSVKKAFVWLTENGIKFQFHDFKKEGVTEAKIKEWLSVQPLDIVLNKKGTTWKGLTGVAQKKANNEKDAIKLMIENTSLIKRPVVELEDTVLVGFNEEVFSSSFEKK